jgi:hypothetical protein
MTLSSTIIQLLCFKKSKFSIKQKELRDSVFAVREIDFNVDFVNLPPLAGTLSRLMGTSFDFYDERL